jgi:hypothetical protein
LCLLKTIKQKVDFSNLWVKPSSPSKQEEKAKETGEIHSRDRCADDDPVQYCTVLYSTVLYSTGCTWYTVIVPFNILYCTRYEL